MLLQHYLEKLVLGRVWHSAAVQKLSFTTASGAYISIPCEHIGQNGGLSLYRWVVTAAVWPV
jgi:hypothetical protein